MNHLYRELAPITDGAWSALDDEARTRLEPALGARRLVDFTGPLGWQHSAANLGRVGAVVDAPEAGVTARLRRVLPLAEVRADFTLAREELDSISRGALDADLSPLDLAAARIAAVENSAVLAGWEVGGVTGVAASSPHEALVIGDDPSRLAQVVAAAVETLKRAGIGGPYALAVDADLWVQINGGSDQGGSPLLRHLENIVEGGIEWAPGIDGAVVLSRRGGDFVFESGQDLSLGYSSHTADQVSLYLLETFSFRVATPEAAIAIR